MNKNVQIAFLLSVAVGLSAGVAMATPVSNTQACASQVKTYSYQAGDKNFVAIADTLSSYFTTRADSTQLIGYQLPKTRLMQDAVESIRVTATITSCGVAAARVAQGTNPGGCNYVGCVGSLPAEFDTMPVGSVVTMSACGGGQTTSATYIKASNGNWVMTKFSTVRTPMCPPTG